MMPSHEPMPLPRMITLPAELEAAIARSLQTVPEARWLREAQALSERYRAARDDSPNPLATGSLQALGYAALILPATYAQLRGAMAATAARIPTWSPRTMLDLGSGPGTALWAAAAQWPSVEQMVAYEREPALIALGRELARRSETPALCQAQWQRMNLADLPPAPAQRYDLVVLGHVLNELAPELQRAVVAQAWAVTAGVLLIVEPGTSAAFPHVRAARDGLLQIGAHTIAPCAHDHPCPLQNEWCHFPQRLKRPAFQRRARGALGEWEDTKFAYAALARFAPAAPIWGRVIIEPTANKAYAEALVSAQNGVTWQRALKRHKDAYRVIKDLPWGAALPEPLEEPITALPHSPFPHA
jgi:ribosomal protein RSM22 (predicted rRNA methylase)